MMIRTWVTRLFCLVILAFISLVSPAVYAQEKGPIYTTEVEGIVTSATVGYINRALNLAEANNATALVIQLSSTGAVLRNIRPAAVEIAKARIPVVVYITPEGTQSGAAGAFFLSASHIAAMAPDTSFGSPVPLADVDRVLSEQTKSLVLDSVSQELYEWNDRHGRNTDWIDRAVRDGVLLNNEQAFSTTPPTVDIIAQDMEELLTLLEGRTVQLSPGEEVQLETFGRKTTVISPSLWESFLLFLSDPTVAFLLMVMGCIALYAELVHPGVGIFAGISGIFLIGALIGFVMLPVRGLSVAGLVLAFALIAADLFVPTHGGLTLAGLVLMIVSSMTLIDAAQAPDVFVALWAILLVALAVAIVAAIAIWLIVRLRKTPVSTGQEGLVGRMAEVRSRLEPEGMVFVDGALWRAFCESGIVEKGDWVVVKEVHELRLVVTKAQKNVR